MKISKPENKFAVYIFPWIFVAVVAAGLILLLVLASTSKAAPVPAFDHSNCQYPYRKSNPANGCDNSDPADPSAAAKGY